MWAATRKQEVGTMSDVGIRANRVHVDVLEIQTPPQTFFQQISAFGQHTYTTINIPLLERLRNLFSVVFLKVFNKCIPLFKRITYQDSSNNV